MELLSSGAVERTSGYAVFMASNDTEVPQSLANT